MYIYLIYVIMNIYIYISYKVFAHHNNRVYRFFVDLKP